MPIPSTITSPQQGRIQRLLALQQPEAAPSVVNFEPSIEPAAMALMQGLTNAKSEHQAAEKARQIASLPKPQITTTVDPATGFTVVNAKGLVLGDDPDATVQAAYDQPQDELLEAIAPHLRARNEPLPGANGQIPSDIAEKLTSWRGRYQVARMMGSNPFGAFFTTTGISARPAAWQAAEERQLGEEANRKRIEKGIRLAERDSKVMTDFRAAKKADIEERRARVTFMKNATEFDRSQRGEIAKTIQSTPFAYLPEGVDPYDYAAQAAGLPALPDHMRPLVDASIKLSALSKTKEEQAEARKVEDQRLQVARDARAARHTETMERIAGDLAAGRIDERTARREERNATLAIDLGEKYQKADAPYREMEDNVSKARALLNRATGPADYMALISAVSSIDGTAAREGEVAVMRSAQSLMDRMKTEVAKLKAGEILSPNVRKEILASIEGMYASVKPRRERIKARYGRLADKAQVPRNSIFDDEDAPAATHTYVPGKGVVKK